MLCSPTNAYPNNNCIDGSNFSMKITFNGDFCMGADFYVYDYQTGDRVGNIYYERGKSTDGFRNGEEIDIVNTSDIPQNTEYLWRAKFYEPVDIDNGYYPDVYSSKGKIQKNPLTKVTVQSTDEDITNNIYIPIEKGLDINLPCYCYWSGNGRKTVVGYNKSKGILKLSEAFDDKNAIPVSTELYLSTVKVVNMDTVLSETGLIPIEQGLNLDTGKHRKTRADSDTIPNTYIKVNGSYYGITKYYNKTGFVGIEGTVPEIDENTPYEIYQCFVISPYYYFNTKAIPVITPKMTFVNEVIKCEASITTQGNYPIKYYYWTIYDKDDNIINQSEKIWSSRMEYLFREVLPDATFKGKITIVTQDDVEVTSPVVNCTIPKGAVGITDLKATVDTVKNTVKLTWKNATGVTPTSYIIQRINSDGTQQYLETIQKTSATSYIDYTCGGDMIYQYIVIPVTTTTVYQQAKVPIATKFDDYEIYFLTEVPYERPSKSITDVRIYYNYMYGDKQFKVTSSWKVQLNPDIGNVDHNIKRDKSDTERGKPVITYGNMDYDSFSLSFLLGHISCPDYGLTDGDYKTFQKWKSDVNSKQPVLIKDIVGNVWFGAITSHTYTPDDSGNYKTYTIKIDFVQTRDMYADNQTRTRIITD